MLTRKKDLIDLIEEITPTAPNGLREGTEVAGEEPVKKTDDDETDAPAADAAPAVSVVQAPAPEPKPLQTEDADTAAAEAPTTKAGLISTIYQKMAGMTAEDLSAVFANLAPAPAVTTKPADEPAAPAEKISEGDDSDAVAANTDSGDAKAKQDADHSAAPTDPVQPPLKTVNVQEDGADKVDNDDEDTDEDEKKVEESLTALFAGNTALTEEFRKNASSLFESAVAAKAQKLMSEKIDVLEENYKAQLTTEVAKSHSVLAESVDKYLAYVVEQWMKDNAVAIERGLRTEIAEGFITGLQSLFRESYISVPEGKENLVESLNKEISKLEKLLMDTTSANIKLNENVGELMRAKVLAEASSGLTTTDASKLATLSADVEFTDASTFTQKLTALKESFLRKRTASPRAVASVTTDDLNEESIPSGSMAIYANAITQTLKKL